MPAATPTRSPPLRAAVDAACAAVGRDPRTLDRTIGVLVDQRRPSERPRPDRGPLSPGQPEPLTGTPEDLADALRGFAREGISHVQIAPLVNGVAGVEALAPVLEILDRG